MAQLKYPRVTPLVTCGAHGYLIVMGGCINYSISETIIELIHLKSYEHLSVEISIASELNSIRTSLNFISNSTFNWRIYPTHFLDKVWLSHTEADKHTLFSVSLSVDGTG